MSADVKTIILLTFAVIILAWVLRNAKNADTVTTSLASNYATTVKALLPTQ